MHRDAMTSSLRPPGSRRVGLCHDSRCSSTHNLVLLFPGTGREGPAVGQVPPWPETPLITTHASPQERIHRTTHRIATGTGAPRSASTTVGRERPVPGWLGEREMVRVAGPGLSWGRGPFRAGPDRRAAGGGPAEGC